MDVMHGYNLVSVHVRRHQWAQQQGRFATSSSSNLPNYPRQLCGSYNALMHLLSYIISISCNNIGKLTMPTAK